MFVKCISGKAAIRKENISPNKKNRIWTLALLSFLLFPAEWACKVLAKPKRSICCSIPPGDEWQRKICDRTRKSKLGTKKLNAGVHTQVCFESNLHIYENISWGNILKCRCPNVKEFVWLFDKWPFIMPSASLRTFPSNSFQISWDVIYDWSSGEERGLSKAHK